MRGHSALRGGASHEGALSRWNGADNRNSGNSLLEGFCVHESYLHGGRCPLLCFVSHQALGGEWRAPSAAVAGLSKA